MEPKSLSSRLDKTFENYLLTPELTSQMIQRRAMFFFDKREFSASWRFLTKSTADDSLDSPAVSNQGRALAVIGKELKEILQGLAIGMCAGPELIYQGWAQLIAGLSAFPCGGLFNYQL